jgi:hypothetical protein
MVHIVSLGARRASVARMSGDIRGSPFGAISERNWALKQAASSPDGRSDIRGRPLRGDAVPGCRFAHPGYNLISSMRATKTGLRVARACC